MRSSLSFDGCALPRLSLVLWDGGTAGLCVVCAARKNSDEGLPNEQRKQQRQHEGRPELVFFSLLRLGTKGIRDAVRDAHPHPRAVLTRSLSRPILCACLSACRERRCRRSLSPLFASFWQAIVFHSRTLLFSWTLFPLLSSLCLFLHVFVFWLPDDAGHLTAVSGPSAHSLWAGQVACSLPMSTAADSWCQRTGVGWRCAGETDGHDDAWTSSLRIMPAIQRMRASSYCLSAFAALRRC